MTLTDEQRARLRAFRVAAAQVRGASIIDLGTGISVSGTAGPGGADVVFDLLAEEPFRSLAMSVRLVYQNDEPANFGSVCNLLHLRGEPSVQHDVAQVRGAYNDLLNGGQFTFHLHGDLEGTVVRNREILETWLYHGAFHLARDREAAAHELSNYGAPYLFAVNALILQLAGRILDLDDIIAGVLGEPELPRL